MKLNSLVTIALLTASALLSACSESGSDGDSFYDNQQTFENRTELDKAVDAFAVTCQGECPESAGVLLITNKNTLSTCSFSLVGSGLILTNRHCLPEDIAKVDANCGEHIKAVFMKDGAKEVYSCDKVSSIGPELTNAKIKDYAFLKLKKAPARKALSISRAGVQDGETLTAITATPFKIGGDIGSSLISKTCEVHMNSLVSEQFTNGFKPVLSMKNCDIVGGNSGSALLNAQGEIVAVVQANFSNTSGLPHLQNAEMALALRSGKFALGTNILCTENKELGLPDSVCDNEVATYSINKDMQNLVPQIVEEFALEVNKINLESPILRFKIQTTNSAGKISLSVIPDCINGSTKEIPWLTLFKPEGFRGWFSSYPDLSEQFISANSYEVSVRINQDIRMELNTFKVPKLYTYAVPVKQIAEQKTQEFTVTNKLVLLGNTIDVPWTVKMCEN